MDLKPKKIREIKVGVAYLKKLENGQAELEPNPTLGESYIELPLVAGG